MDSLYSGVNMQKVFPDMTDGDLENFYEENIKSRDIIGDYIITTIKSISNRFKPYSMSIFFDKAIGFL